MTTPSEAIRFFRDLADNKEITEREKQVALKRWAQVGAGYTWFVRQGVKFLIPNDAMTCDCGKGLYCSMIGQYPETKVRDK